MKARPSGARYVTAGGVPYVTVYGRFSPITDESLTEVANECDATKVAVIEMAVVLFLQMQGKKATYRKENG